jgi:hypothetical protein
MKPGDFVRLRNNWIIGPLEVRKFTGPGGTLVLRWAVAGPCTLDWDHRTGKSYLQEYDIMAIMEEIT